MACKQVLGSELAVLCETGSLIELLAGHVPEAPCSAAER